MDVPLSAFDGVGRFEIKLNLNDKTNENNFIDQDLFHDGGMTLFVNEGALFWLPYN